MELTREQLDALKEKGYCLEGDKFRDSRGIVAGNREGGIARLHYNTSDSPLRMESALGLRDALDEIGVEYTERPSTASETIRKKGERWIKIAERMDRGK